MSLILDALNRADKERSYSSNHTSLANSLGPTASSASPVRRWIIEALLVSAALGAIGYNHFSDNASESLKPVERNAGILAQPLVDVDVKPSATAANSHMSVAVSEQEFSPATPSPRISAPFSTAPPVANKVSQGLISSLYQQPNSETEPSSSGAAKPPPAIAQRKDETQSILREIPFLSQLSYRFQQTVPDINYSVHLYSASQGAGRVKINGALRKIGSEISPQLRVIAILNDSIVLDFNGRQFRLLALNSWVNLH